MAICVMDANPQMVYESSNLKNIPQLFSDCFSCSSENWNLRSLHTTWTNCNDTRYGNSKSL